MAIQLYMFSSFMEDGIAGDINRRLASECKGTGKVGEADKSAKSRTSQVISAVTRLMDRYSDSADDKEMESCFFDFHEMGEPPSVIKKLMKDRRESLQAAKSASQNATRSKEGAE